jgi:endoglucanase
MHQLNARLLTLLLLFISACNNPTSSQSNGEGDFPTAAQVTLEMASGVNLGNVFENGYQNIEFYELAAFITTYQRAGMKHIRIPTTWIDGVQGSSLADEQGHVNFDHPRFAILKQVIDFAIDRDLYVVLNAHHERTFKANYDGSEFYNNQFSTLWTDIANHFKDYDHRLIFEILNEPEGAFGHWGTEVSPVSDQALLFTRGVMQLGVQAIRATGGNNLHRTVMIATNAYGNHNQIFSVYPNKASLPGGGSDEYLSIQVHSYDPWEFCGEDGSNDAYPGDEITANTMRSVAEHGRMLGVPINYGEFGVGRNGSQSDRNTDLVRNYYKTVVQTALEENMSSTVWDDRGWFGLVEGDVTSGFSFKYGIVPFMLEN